MSTLKGSEHQTFETTNSRSRGINKSSGFELSMVRNEISLGHLRSYPHDPYRTQNKQEQTSCCVILFYIISYFLNVYIYIFIQNLTISSWIHCIQ